MASTPVNINFNIVTPSVEAFKRSQNMLRNMRSSSISTIDPRHSIPVHLVQESIEYRKLLELYKDRFEKWPDAEMREILFKQAIDMVASVE